MKVKDRILWTQWGEHARSILRQYNEFTDFSGNSMRFWGPHYVVREQGEFFMRPYGQYADKRYDFHCRPEFIPGAPEPLWTFVVL